LNQVPSYISNQVQIGFPSELLSCIQLANGCYGFGSSGTGSCVPATGAFLSLELISNASVPIILAGILGDGLALPVTPLLATNVCQSVIISPETMLFGLQAVGYGTPASLVAGVLSGYNVLRFNYREDKLCLGTA